MLSLCGQIFPRPTDNLSTLAVIQPAELCRKGATLSLTRRAMEPGHLLYSALTCPPSGNARRLQSKHPFAEMSRPKIRDEYFIKISET